MHKQWCRPFPPPNIGLRSMPLERFSRAFLARTPRSRRFSRNAGWLVIGPGTPRDPPAQKLCRCVAFYPGKTRTCTNSCAGPPRPPTRSPTLERLAGVFFLAVTEDRAHTFGLWFVSSFCRCASVHHPSVAIACSRLEARGHAVGFCSLGIRHMISRGRSFCRCAAAQLLHIMLLLHVHVRGSMSSSQMLLRAWNHRQNQPRQML